MPDPQYWKLDLIGNGLSPNGPGGDDPQNDGGKRRARIRRRRLIALGVAILVVAVAIAVPLISLGAGEGSTASTDGLPASESDGTGESGEADESASDPADLGEEPDPKEIARALGVNELGLIPVLMYTRIADDAVPPERLREDIDRLKAAGFYPTTVREMVEGTMDIPAGKSPIVLTFDDSSPTQFQMDFGAVALEPDCAVAILQAATSSGDWASRASFFPLLEVNKDNILFGQKEYAEQAVRDLVDWGYEVGSHTTNHRELSLESSDVVRRELAVSKSRLEEIIGDDYQVYTLAPPYGELPDDLSLLTDGVYKDLTYHYSAVVMSSGGYSASPFSGDFNAVRIPRIDATAENTVPRLISYFQNNPGLRYVSDGNPDILAFPVNASSTLGRLRSELTQEVLTY